MSITPQQALARCIEHREISHDEMLVLMRMLMRGELAPELAAALLVALRTKNETVGEITAAAQVMREFVEPVSVADHKHLLDLCGTGGDNTHTFNISTASMFAAAAAGARVAKHGNRRVSSSSGSADVLQSLGVNLTLSSDQVAQVIGSVGVGFMFAPHHHSAMKNIAAIRQTLGVRTIFNILGPLTNPAGAPYQLMGVFHPDLVGIQVRVLQRLGAKHVLVVHGQDGMDEATLGASTLVGELKEGEILEYVIHPEDFGLQMVSNRSLRVNTVEESRALLLAALENVPGPARDIVAFNAGIALYAAEIVTSIADGVLRAQETLATGAARAKLDEFVRLTQTYPQL